MSVFSDKQYPVWFIVVAAVTTLVIALYAVRPLRTFTSPEGEKYVGGITIDGLDEIPFLVSFDKSSQSANFIFFDEHIPVQTIAINSMGSLLGTVKKPLPVTLYGRQYELTGVGGVSSIKGRVTGERGVLLGRWYAHEAQQMAATDTPKIASNVVTWKQSQELMKLKTKEEKDLNELNDEQQKLKETLIQQASIQTEGGRKLARAKRELDDKTLFHKKITNDLTLTRGRIVLVQKISPQGKFLSLSRQSLKDEAQWFFESAKV